MESVGEYLRKERELRNLTLTAIAESTKIQYRYLEAIEGDRYDRLPPRFYTRSYITLYAKFLGIDPGEAILRYQGGQEPPPVTPREIVKQPAVPARRNRLWIYSLPALIGMIVFVLFSTTLAPQKRSEKRHAPEPFKPVASAAVSLQEAAVILPPPEIPAKAEQKPVEPQVSGSRVSEARRDLPKGDLPKGDLPKDETSEEAPGPQVLAARVGRGINAEGPGPKLVGESGEFEADHQRVYFFTRVQTPREGKIAHVWILGQEEIQRIEVDVKPPTWSTYSYVTIRPNQVGDWKVEARDGDTVLSTQTFKVIESDSVT
jgi:cytoskeletal protein RodZ